MKRVVKTGAAAVGLVLWLTGAAFAQTADQTALAKTVSEPAGYYDAAEQALAAGKANDAAFLFYLGQLRWRYALGGSPHAEAQASFDRRTADLGAKINPPALADKAMLAATLEAVTAFDAAHPDQTAGEAAIAPVRSEFAEFVRYIRSEARLEEMRRKHYRPVESGPDTP
jgi:hypothetical protein